MSYRVGEPKKHPEPNRSVQKVTTPSKFYMSNGTVFHLAYPCWYKEVHPPVRAVHHCGPWHDHVGQPSPNHPDHVCQPHDFAHFWHDHSYHHNRNHNRYGIQTWGHSDHDCPHPHWHSRHLIDMCKLWPIHLIKEGYTDVDVSLTNKIEGFSISGIIDPDNDWIVRLIATADIDAAITEPWKTRFSVRVKDYGSNRTDMVAIGDIVVLPAPID